MTLFHSFILGIVEGITEFLPISSTAHIAIAGYLLKIVQNDFFKSFSIIIQLGAIMPVVWFYLRTHTRNMEIHKRVMAAFVPTAVIGFVLYKFIKFYLIGNMSVIAGMLLVGGIIIIWFERQYTEDATAIQSVEKIPYKTAFWIGVAQAIAVVPGVSRSAATIIAGLYQNISRRTIVEFSFLVAVPTMVAATAYDLLKNYHTFSRDNISSLAVGFITALIFAQLSINYLLKFVRTNTFTNFGIYRIVIASGMILVYIFSFFF